jgi:hypothetical protein
VLYFHYNCAFPLAFSSKLFSSRILNNICLSPAINPASYSVGTGFKFWTLHRLAWLFFLQSVLFIATKFTQYIKQIYFSPITSYMFLCLVYLFREAIVFSVSLGIRWLFRQRLPCSQSFTSITH